MFNIFRILFNYIGFLEVGIFWFSLKHLCAHAFYAILILIFILYIVVGVFGGFGSKEWELYMCVSMNSGWLLEYPKHLGMSHSWVQAISVWKRQCGLVGLLH